MDSSPCVFLTLPNEKMWKYMLTVYLESKKENLLLTCFSSLLLGYFHRDAKVPSPPPGHKWKEVRHDNKVTWLVSWTENIQGSIKYIMLNPSSRIKVKIS